MNTEDITKTRLTSNGEFRGFMSNIMVLISSTYTSLSHRDQFLHSCRLGIVFVLANVLSSSNFRNPNIGNPESIMNTSRCFSVS